VRPAYPYIRLWPDSVRHLFGEGADLPRLTPNWDKRYLDLAGPSYAFQTAPLPLGAVYVLGERVPQGALPEVEALPAREALVTLLANSYRNELLDSAMRATEFALIGRLVNSVPVRRVRPVAGRDQLPLLCDTVIADFRQFTT